jgi:hypothetical protein
MEPNIPLTKVESSRIHSIGHDPETNTLAVRFLGKDDKPGNLYYYSNFDAEEFEHFSNAESIGSYHAKNIKPFDKRYPYIKIDETAQQAA